MLWLKDNIAKIESLLQQGTQQSITYAALECRLAIEMVCYERLRVSHEYISHDEVRRWQPKHVIDILIAEANETVAESFTLSMSTVPVNPEVDMDAEAFSKVDYIEVGRQIGFDPKQIGRLWNALSSFLHVRLPKSNVDEITTYGATESIKAKVVEALNELSRLKEGTLVSSGMGLEVSFTCRCGSLNKRRASLLKDRSILSCINPECEERYKAHALEGDEFEFERVCIEVKCRSCGDVGYFPEAAIIKVGLNRMITYDCEVCGEKNALRWALQRAK